MAKNIYKLLRMILADAMSEGLLAENPCVPEVLPEGVAAKRKAAIPEPSHFRFYEINALEKACAGEYWGPLILFAYITGLPQGELLALRLSDIIRREDDPTQYSALIRNTLKRVKTTSAGHDAKTALQLVRCKPYTIALPIRAVRIIEQRANLIRRLQELDPKRNPEQLIFTTQDGKPVEANVLRDNLVRLERKAGINEMPFSALRETAIRKAIGEAIMANRDEHTVMPQFGIRDREAFTRKYRHLIVNTKALVQEVAESERYHDSTNVQQGGLQ